MFCKHCGAPLNEKQKFCPRCGTPVPSKVASEPQDKNNDSVAVFPIFAVIAVGILLVILILYYAGVLNTISSPFKNKNSEAGGNNAFGLNATWSADQLKDYQSIYQALGQAAGTWDMKLISTDVSQYPLVKLYVSIRDQNDQDVVLESPTAGIRECIGSGKEIERTVRNIQQINQKEGIGFELLMDKSESMTDELSEMQRILDDFVNSLDFSVGDKAELISFDTYLMYMTTLTGDPSLLHGGIRNMTAYGRTALYDALYTGVQNAAARPGANCVICFTDGIENASSHSLDEVISLAKKLNVPVYLIGTSEADANTLNEIATATNGHCWTIDQLPDMKEILNTISQDQRNLYTVEYESVKDADAFSERSISLAVVDAAKGKASGNNGNKNGGGKSPVGASFQMVHFTPAKKQEVVKHNSRYEIIRGDFTWTDANDAARARGGHLATITSQSEMDTCTQLADKEGIRYLWIGGYTSVRNGSAFGHWITGEPFDYAVWYPGEPSRNDLDGTPEFYLMLWKIKDVWSWNDQRDQVTSAGDAYMAGKMGYLCEYEQ